MPALRQGRLDQGEDGFTLIELLVAMTITVALLGVILQLLAQSSLDQQDVENRTEAQNNAQIGLERMSRELRQADWVYLRSTSVVDADVKVRATATGTAVDRLVRYDCSGDVCQRLEGPPVIYPPGAAPAFTAQRTVIGSPGAEFANRNGQLVGNDVFRPFYLDPATGTKAANYTVDANYLQIRVRLSTKRHSQALELQDGVALRNRTEYAG